VKITKQVIVGGNFSGEKPVWEICLEGSNEPLFTTTKIEWATWLMRNFNYQLQVDGAIEV
jgi:hypothetical protein